MNSRHVGVVTRIVGSRKAICYKLTYSSRAIASRKIALIRV